MTLEQLKKKIRYGDYGVLGLMLEINPDAAKMRFLRKDAEAIEAMRLWVTQRDNFVTQYQQLKKKETKETPL